MDTLLHYYYYFTNEAFMNGSEATKVHFKDTTQLTLVDHVIRTTWQM